MRSGVLCLSVLVACGKVPDVEKDAAVDAENVPDAPTMCAELVSECAGSTVLRECTTVGQPAVDTTCDLGCSPDGGAHCRTLQPSFELLPEDLKPTGGLAEITLSALSTINTDDGSITNLRTAGTGLISGIDFTVRNGVGIFRFQKLTITGNTPAQSLTFSGANAVALVAIRSIEATGTIFNVQGNCTGSAARLGGNAGGGAGVGAKDTSAAVNGGASAGTRGGKGGVSSTTESEYACGGGGGGAHAGAGGGGAMGGAYAGGVGGQSDTTSSFAGGGGGGGGGGPWDGSGAPGGAGGGAIHLTANLLVKITGGGIQAGGCGGSNGGCPGGGGAGGTVVLEANDVEISNATLAANGGGGGSCAARGTAGILGTGGAPGGNSSTGCGAGANGSSNIASNGSTATTATGFYGSGGGGGGGAGRIILRSGDGLLTTGSAVFSPATMTGTAPIN